MNVSGYQVAWYVSIALFLINVAIAAIQAAYAAGHGADLGISSQVQAWLAIISTVIAAALAFLPRLQQTPGTREESYLLAAQGKLPHDLAKRYPLIMPPPPPTPAVPASMDDPIR